MMRTVEEKPLSVSGPTQDRVGEVGEGGSWREHLLGSAGLGAVGSS